MNEISAYMKCCRGIKKGSYWSALHQEQLLLSDLWKISSTMGLIMLFTTNKTFKPVITLPASEKNSLTFRKVESMINLGGVNVLTEDDYHHKIYFYTYSPQNLFIFFYNVILYSFIYSYSSRRSCSIITSCTHANDKMQILKSIDHISCEKWVKYDSSR